MRTRSHSRRLTSAAVLPTAALLVLSACGSSGSSSGGGDNNKNAPSVTAQKAQQWVGGGQSPLNRNRGEANAKTGTNQKPGDGGPPHQQHAGWKGKMKNGNTSDEMLTLISGIARV